MIKQFVTLIALPNGITGAGADRRLHLSVFVAPRLQTDQGTTLAPFDFVDWPAHLQPGKVSFSVKVDQGPLVPAEIAAPPPDPALWKALFTQNTFVRSHTFDRYVHRPMMTYSARDVHAQLRQGYTQVATASPHTTPSHANVMAAFPGLHALFASDALNNALPVLSTAPQPSTTFFKTQNTSTLAASVASMIALSRRQSSTLRAQFAATLIPPAMSKAVRVFPAATAPGDHYAHVLLFHFKDSKEKPVSLPKHDQKQNDFEQMIDFHQMLSSLNDYPTLLRKLGLVIDLSVPLTAFLANPAKTSGRLQIMPAWTPAPPLLASPPAFTPWTQYILDPDHFFLPAPRPGAQGASPEMLPGFLNLSHPDYELVQVDLDGGTLKLANMARSTVARAEAAGGTGQTDEDGTLPVLRSGGVSLVRANHVDALNEIFRNAHNNNLDLEARSPGLTFYAEDLTRGYRVDVFDSDTKSWHSLHRRSGSYTVHAPGGASALPPISDEGCLQIAVAQPATPAGSQPDPDAELALHESLFRWEGWSLSAPRPGKSINRNPRAPTPGDPTTQPEKVPNAPVTQFPLQAEFTAAPGSLPRLRFGTAYQFRVRTVDLAGNSLSLDDANRLQSANRPVPLIPPKPGDFIYRRFEPVTAPALVPRERFGEGESQERLVIRSNHDTTAEAYAAKHPRYKAVNERHIVPPKTFELMAEMLRLLDKAFGPNGTAKALYCLARKEKGSLADPFLLNSTNETQQTLTSVEFVKTGGPGDTGNNGYAIHHEEHLRIPYLPDLLARGALLRNLPGTAAGTVGRLDAVGSLRYQPSTLPPEVVSSAGTLTHIDFGSATNWPDLLPFRLQLAEGSGPPEWDHAARILKVHLPPAEQATINLSSYLLEEDLKLLGLCQWLQEAGTTTAGTPADLPLLQAAHSGLLWMLTPSRPITLVHAVQQPLAQPQILALTAQKAGTRAYLGGTIQLHGKSTAKLDLLASWTDQVDRPDEDAPRMITAQAHVFEFPIHLPGEVTSTPAPTPNLSPVGVYDPAKDQVSLLAPVEKPVHGGGHLHGGHGGTTNEGPPHHPPVHNGDDDNGDDSEQPDPTIYTSVHEFGDTRYRKVTYRASATSRFREYFPPEQASDPDTSLSRTGDPVTVEILNSARPVAPKVLYMVPAFAWEKPADPTALQQTRVRGGNCLRVYLDRPWYSSGDGELLGVLVGEFGDPYVTRWGVDPIYDSKYVNVPFLAGVSVFKRTKQTGSGSTEERVPRSILVHGNPTFTIDPVGVDVAGYEVNWDDRRKLWYADIEVDPGASYYPFIHLALVRYQPQSLAGLEISSVVLADFVQIAPTRTITLTTTPDRTHYTVVVKGLTYHSNAGPVPTVVGPNMVGLARVSVSVQQRIPGTTDEIGWQAASDPAIQVQPDQMQIDPAQDEGTVLWSGQISLPSGHARGQYRLLIQEFELFQTDNPPVLDPPRPQPVHHHPPHHPPPPGHLPDGQHHFPNGDDGTDDDDGGTEYPYSVTQRLVFADAIEV